MARRTLPLRRSAIVALAATAALLLGCGALGIHPERVAQVSSVQAKLDVAKAEYAKALHLGLAFAEEPGTPPEVRTYLQQIDRRAQQAEAAATVALAHASAACTAPDGASDSACVEAAAQTEVLRGVLSELRAWLLREGILDVADAVRGAGSELLLLLAINLLLAALRHRQVVEAGELEEIEAIAKRLVADDREATKEERARIDAALDGIRARLHADPDATT